VALSGDEAAIRKMAVEVSDPLGGVLRTLLGMIDREREQVRAKTAEHGDVVAKYRGARAAWEARETELKQQAVRLRDALARYGEHDGDCAVSVEGAPGDAKCTCGLEDEERARK